MLKRVRDSIKRLFTFKAKARYELDNEILKSKNYIIELAEDDGLKDVSQGDISKIALINTNEDAHKVVVWLRSIGIPYFDNDPSKLFKDKEVLVKGKYFNLVRSLLILQSVVKTFTDGMDWEKRGEILKFFGFIDPNRELHEKLVEDEYIMHHEIYSSNMREEFFEETEFDFKSEVKRSKSMNEALKVGLKGDNPKLINRVISDLDSKYFIYNIRSSKVNVYVPIEHYGVLLLNGNTLARRTYLVRSGSKNVFMDVLPELLNRSIRSINRVAHAFNLNDDYYAHRLQETIFSILYRQQIIKTHKFNPYSILETRQNKASDLEIILELHKVYFARHLFSSDPERFNLKENLGALGIYDMHSFPLRNRWTSWAHSDYITTKGDNLVRYITPDKMPLAYYIYGKRMADMNTNKNRTALGMTQIARAMPIYDSDGNVVPFDKRTEEDILPTPKEWNVDFNRGYYIWTVDFKYDDPSGNISHEGARLLNRSLIDMGLRIGDKLDDGFGDKGVSHFLSKDVYAYTDNKEKLNLSFFDHTDSAGRDNPASVIAGLEAAERELGNNILEVFTTDENGNEVSLGIHAVSRTYFYLTDHVRGSQADYGETILMDDYEEKTYPDKVRVGQDMLVKLGQLLMEETILSIFGGIAELEELLIHVENHIYNQNIELKGQSFGQSKFGKFGAITRLMQPLIDGYHATALPNRLIPVDEMHLYMSEEHAIYFLRSIEDKQIYQKILSGEPITIAEGLGVRHPMIRISNMIYKKLIIHITYDAAYRFPYFLVNPITHMLMDGDFDGDEVFFYIIKGKKAIEEIKTNLHANNFMPKEYKVGYYNKEFEEWTSIENYISLIERTKGKKYSKPLYHRTPLEETRDGASGIHLSTMLSKELIGRFKGPIMKFELHLTAYVFNENLIEEFGKRLAATSQRLNETYSQPAISMQKWTDNLANAMRHHFASGHLSRILSCSVDGLLFNSRGHLFVNKYFTMGKTKFFKPNFIFGADEDKVEAYLRPLSKLDYNLRDYISEEITEIKEDLTTEYTLTNTHFKLIEEPTAFVSNLLDYINTDFDTDIKSLVALEEFPEDFYYYKEGVEKK